MSGASIKQICNMSTTDEATPNYRSINCIFEAIKSIYLKLSVVGFLLFAIFGSWLAVKPLNNSSFVMSSWVGWFFVLIVASISLYGNAYVALLQGMNKVSWVQRCQMFCSTAAIISSALMLVLFKSLLITVFTFYLWNIFNVIINFIEKQKVLSHQNFAFIKTTFATRMSKKLKKDIILPTAWRSGVGVIFSLGLIQLSGIVFARLAEAKLAAVYMLSLQLIRACSSFSQAPFYSKLPVFAKWYMNKSSRASIFPLAQKRMLYSYCVFIGLFFFLALFGQKLMLLIHSSVQFPNMPVWVAFGLAFLLERFGAMHLQIYTLTNHIIWHIANGVTGALMIIIAVCLFLIFKVSLLSFPVAMLCSYLIFYTPYVVLKSYKAFNKRFFDAEKKAFLPALVILLFLLLVLFLLKEV
ncbi:polysaccharide biosynthesis protein [Facilibium subflavum]|uniref:hypothetical protein n=1 Tax=Facilibium subflavum TaxID=2219058 RepID=UPI0013C2DBB8|nr:hypothetical protein [Facilibium subflavum]